MAASIAARVQSSKPGLADAAPEQMLTGVVGAEVALALSAALQRVEQFASGTRIPRSGLDALRDEIEAARGLAIKAQQWARLASGQVRPSPEAIELPELLREVLRQRAPDIAARGLELRQQLSPTRVNADPGLLVALLQNLLDWAFEHCRAPMLLLSVAPDTWPPRALLRCAFRWRSADRPALKDAAMLDTLAWRMVVQTCELLGVGVERDDSPLQMQLTLAFPGGTASWPTVSVDDASAAPPLPGCRVLVLSAQSVLQVAARRALAGMQVQTRFASTVAEAAWPRDEAPPHVLVADAQLAGLEPLCTALKAGAKGPALVLIGEPGLALDVRSTGHQEVLRLGRDHVLRDLPVALRYALARA